MAVFNLDYYKGTDLYSDGDIENEILDIVKSGVAIEDVGDMKFPVLYHLSKVRENILNWYPFSEDARILEIGSGCGALTGLLCERGKSVTSVELSKRRATINFERNKEKENLEIKVGNLNDMVFPELFDYVVLNGVFEYAMSFTEGEHPYEQFLSFVAGLLKPSGRILIAIENKLGMKYFNGAPEDHTNAYYDGLNQYADNKSVRTFTKAEWMSLMKRCGMDSCRFYYPFPDYKFPKEIFTDETINKEGYGKNEWNFTDYRITLFDEEKVVQNLIEEGIADRFANSFLVDMGRDDAMLNNRVLYAKLNRDRADEFAIATVIERCGEQLQVVKKPLETAAEAHLKKMAEGVSDHADVRNLECKWTEAGLVYPYLETQSLGYQADALIRENRIEELKEMVRMVWDKCLQNGKTEDDYFSEAFRKVFGDSSLEQPLFCVKPANIDLILDNLFPDGSSLKIIDCEWCFDFAVPRQFIIWRTINELYSKNVQFDKVYSKEAFLMEYGIDRKMSEVFWRWSTCFAEEYVKANRILGYTKPKLWFSLESFRQEYIRKHEFTGSLYLDTGNGFSETEKITLIPDIDEERCHYEVDLSAYKEIKALRFDPIEGSPSICKVLQKENSEWSFSAVNAEPYEDGNLFLTMDPIYNIRWKKTMPEKLIFDAKIRKMDLNEVLQCIDAMKQKKQNWKFWRK